MINGENLKINKYYWHDSLSAAKLFDLNCFQVLKCAQRYNIVITIYMNILVNYFIFDLSSKVYKRRL